MRWRGGALVGTELVFALAQTLLPARVPHFAPQASFICTYPIAE